MLSFSGLLPWLCCFQGWPVLFCLQQTRWIQREPAWSQTNRSPKIVQFDVAMWSLCLTRESLQWLFRSVLDLHYRTGSIQEGSSLRWVHPVVPGGPQGEWISEQCQLLWEPSRHHRQVREGPRQTSNSTARRPFFETLKEGMLSLSMTQAPCTITGSGWSLDERLKLTLSKFLAVVSLPTVLMSRRCVSPTSCKRSVNSFQIIVESLPGSCGNQVSLTMNLNWEYL